MIIEQVCKNLFDFNLKLLEHENIIKLKAVIAKNQANFVMKAVTFS